ncbi:MAG: 30S ribosomal protein S13 [Deltaproteobacteria bacterium]|nr:30S ribosomal protein S13 [Deltaproteobacteria bacterium]MCL5878263.1 30S ribosomal protein S13 [Deltaproteobacteria bacterium]
MARIAGLDLPKNKNIWIALTYIYGIGKSLSSSILKEAGIEYNRKVEGLKEDELAIIRKIIENKYKVGGDLKKDEKTNIKRLIDTNSYRGMRHKKGLPVRGQRTHTNARTRKGPRRQTVGGLKKKELKK